MYVVNFSMFFFLLNLIVCGLFLGFYEMFIVVCYFIVICNNIKVLDIVFYYKSNEINMKCINLCVVWMIVKIRDII